MPTEVILNKKEPASFSKTLVLLNERFAILKYGEKNVQIALFLKQCLDKDPTKAYKAFDKLIQYRSIIPTLNQGNPRDNITSPTEIFRFYDLQPYIGDKSEGKKFADKDFIIGLQVECVNLLIKYRLDYDPEKKLHLNLDFYEILIKGGKKIGIELRHKFVLLLKNSTGRFGFTAVPAGDLEMADLTAQAIKFKFWLKMSLAYYYTSNKIIIDQSQADKNQDALSEQFLTFVKGRPHSMDGFKYHISSFEPNISGIIENCLDSQQLITQFQTEKTVRRDITDIFMNMQIPNSVIPSGTVIDSEKFPLSDEPPPGEYL